MGVAVGGAGVGVLVGSGVGDGVAIGAGVRVGPVVGVDVESGVATGERELAVGVGNTGGCITGNGVGVSMSATLAPFCEVAASRNRANAIAAMAPIIRTAAPMNTQRCQ